MDKLMPVGRTFFAVALIGLGIEHFVFKDFVTGRAPPWPEAIPGGLLWTYLTGVAFVILGAAILSGRHVRVAGILTAVLIATALLRHIPVVAVDSFLSGAWTRAGKALTLTGGALAVAATVQGLDVGRELRLRKSASLEHQFILAARISLGLFLIITGFQHFMYTEFVASLIPSRFPGDAVAWTYFAGVALIAGGIGLFVPQTARLAALLSGSMVFSWFWIVHIPRTVVSVSDGIAVFEALAVSGIGFVLAGYLSRRDVGGATGPLVDAYRTQNPQITQISQKQD
jgi:uncharacterized membrane protein